ncbi:MAG: hypothetical protein ACRD4M_04685 [Candidatus Acidiferrales bacterium]
MTDQALKTWKKIAIRAFFGGIGFVVGGAVIIGAFVWYSNRPSPPPSWNSKALKANFDAIEATGASSSSPNTYIVAFEYNVRNTTKTTYEVNPSALMPMALLAECKALSNSFGEYQSGEAIIEAPQIIPPGATGRMTVRVSYFYPQNFTTAEKKDLGKWSRSLDEQLKDLAGIVLFDRVNHYQIDLPSGWANLPGVKQGTKPNIDESRKNNG